MDATFVFALSDSPMRGLYLITNDDPIELLLAKLEGAIATYEVAVLQYRRKNVAKENQAYEIEYMKNMCNQYKVPFVINDDLERACHDVLGIMHMQRLRCPKQLPFIDELLK